VLGRKDTALIKLFRCEFGVCLKKNLANIFYLMLLFVIAKRQRRNLVIIDPKTMHHPKHRPYGVAGAIASFLNTFEVGEQKKVSSVLSPVGVPLSLQQLQVRVSQYKGDMVFVTRRAQDADDLAVITRIK
jgi:hypothetical protein